MDAPEEELDLSGNPKGHKESITNSSWDELTFNWNDEKL